MSRIGRMPVLVPPGVDVRIEDRAEGATIVVKGSRGELTRVFHPAVRFEQDNGVIIVHLRDPDGPYSNIHGLSRSLLTNMVIGVSEGYRKSLEILGAGYRAQEAEQGVTLFVGYSHSVDIATPSGVTVQVEANTRVHVDGIDKEAVGQIAARIRAVRPPGVYTGKGIRYQGEQVRRKAGKGAGRRK